MKDLQNAKTMWLKGSMLMFVGIASSVLLLVETPTLRCGVLLALTVWSFCRAYYFAFYVIEHYIDSSYRFSGLLSFCGYLFQRRVNPPDRR